MGDGHRFVLIGEGLVVQTLVSQHHLLPDGGLPKLYQGLSLVHVKEEQEGDQE